MIWNKCHPDTTADHLLGIAAVVAETASNTGHTEAEHMEVGCIDLTQHYTYLPCGQINHGTYPSDMTVGTTSAR